MNERFDGRLHFNTGKKITAGLIKLGHNVLTISDRDVLHQSKSLFDFDGSKKLNEKIIKTHINFQADLIIMGHADSVSGRTISSLKKINNTKICQWFLDPLVPNGPDYFKNLQRIKKLTHLIDATFFNNVSRLPLKKNTQCIFYPQSYGQIFRNTFCL